MRFLDTLCPVQPRSHGSLFFSLGTRVRPMVHCARDWVVFDESLFTLFASLTLSSLSDDANKIKTLNIERA